MVVGGRGAGRQRRLCRRRAGSRPDATVFRSPTLPGRGPPCPDGVSDRCRGLGGRAFPGLRAGGREPFGDLLGRGNVRRVRYDEGAGAVRLPVAPGAFVQQDHIVVRDAGAHVGARSAPRASPLHGRGFADVAHRASTRGPGTARGSPAPPAWGPVESGALRRRGRRVPPAGRRPGRHLGRCPGRHSGQGPVLIVFVVRWGSRRRTDPPRSPRRTRRDRDGVRRPARGPTPRVWVTTTRSRRPKLPAERIAALDALGMRWTQRAGVRRVRGRGVVCSRHPAWVSRSAGPDRVTGVSAVVLWVRTDMEPVRVPLRPTGMRNHDRVKRAPSTPRAPAPTAGTAARSPDPLVLSCGGA